MVMAVSIQPHNALIIFDGYGSLHSTTITMLSSSLMAMAVAFLPRMRLIRGEVVVRWGWMLISPEILLKMKGEKLLVERNKQKIIDLLGSEMAKEGGGC